MRDFLDKARFKIFQINNGHPVWGDFELCFPIMDRYRGEFLNGAAQDLPPIGYALGLFL